MQRQDDAEIFQTEENRRKLNAQFNAFVKAPGAAGPLGDSVLPSRIARGMDALRAKVLDCGADWNGVKKSYLDQPEQMREILAFRKWEVDRVFKLTLAEMLRDFRGQFTADELKFVAVGSEDLTSDYDVTFDHTPAKPWLGIEAVQRFNRTFRQAWGKESGTVFDTNVYTPGFMPFGLADVPIGVPKMIDERAKRAKKLVLEDRVSTFKDLADLAFLEARLDDRLRRAKQARATLAGRRVQGRFKPSAEDAAAARDLVQIQDVMALTKTRRFMTSEQWTAYSASILEGIASPEMRSEVQASLGMADAMFVVLQGELEAKKQQLRSGRSEVDEGDLELEANNRIYEEYLGQVGQAMQNLDHARWAEAQSRALFFANEAYHAGGSVEGVVIGQQMGIEHRLTREQHLQSINEQTGFALEQMEHNAGNLGRALWKSSKYVDRICLTIGQLNLDPAMARRPFTPTRFDDIRALASALMKIKQSADSDATKSQKAEATARASGFDRIASWRDAVLTLAREANQQLRGAPAVAARL